MRKNLFRCNTLLAVLFLMFLTVNLSQASVKPQWARYPAISPDGTQIVFTYKGDLYRVPVDGGEAIRLTFHPAHDHMPVWSPDGRQIAFASDRYGNFDVFVMDFRGGEAERLTFHSNDEFPYRFTPDATQVVFGGIRQDLVSHRQYPVAYQPELYQVPLNGGRVTQLLTVPAEHVDFSKDGRFLAYHDKKGGENEWRKHHQSSVARDLWIYDMDHGTHQQLTNFYGENRHPIFADQDQSLYYLSELSGSFNVHKLSIAQPSKSIQLTYFERHPVRSLSASEDGLLCFSYDGELYTVREGADPQKVDITIRTQAVANTESLININGGVQEMDISPNGKEIVFIARGEVFVTSVDGKFTKRITDTPEQERFVSFSPDGKSIIYARETKGRWEIVKAYKTRDDEPFFFASTLLLEEPLISTDKDNYQPQISPDGKWIAFIEERRTLKIMNLESKEEKTLLTPEHLFHMRDGDQYFTWSPDSRWLLATYRPTMANSEVVLLDVTGEREMVNLTLSGYSDFRPKWINNGEQIVWFSNRHGMRGHANSGGSQSDVYALFLTRESWEKFQLDKDEFTLFKALEKRNSDTTSVDKEKQSTSKVEPKPIEIDWEGLTDRKTRLTIHSSSLSDAVLSKDGETLYYLTSFEKGSNLWSTNLRTKETKMEISLEASGGNLTWDHEMKFLYLLSGGRISKINLSSNRRESVQIAGRMRLDTDAERLHAFDHVWLRTKKMFYTPDMHGVDWNSLRTEYQKYVPHVGNNYEFAELLSEMLGELNVSHAGARYSRSMPDGDQTASLGVFMDYHYMEVGIRVLEVLQGGPLDRAGIEIVPGTIIEQVDGEMIATDRDVAAYLNHKAGEFVGLTVFNPETGERKQITVKPITLLEENRLLYRRWVRANQAEVDRLSDGKLGYVHIPGMNEVQYRNIYEEMMGKFPDREGVIVDTRFNGGGDLVADLAMFFTGEKFLEYATEDRAVGYEPTFRWIKPTLAMFNEANYSDGHCFSCGYTELGIGKTVGMPVPGTCSFAGWERLPNGVRWGAVPVSVRNKAGEWLENNETRPMFEIKNDPEVIAEGRDQQLEKAIEELLKSVADE